MSRIYNSTYNAIKAALPQRVRRMGRQYRQKRFDNAVRGGSTQEIFEAVYKKRIWGVAPGDGRFSSGSGTHDADIVDPYIASVSSFVKSLPTSCDAVDLGCGDFAVGSRLRPLFNRFVACDVVPDVLAQNRLKYSSLDVDFRLIDIAKDDLPRGDVVLIRQVFQHLSNELIARALEKIQGTYSMLILTEHVPLAPGFIPNVDIPTGPGIRLGVQSGVDITEPPFNVSPAAAEVLCSVKLEKSLIRTVMFKF